MTKFASSPCIPHIHKISLYNLANKLFRETPAQCEWPERKRAPLSCNRIKLTSEKGGAVPLISRRSRTDTRWVESEEPPGARPARTSSLFSLLDNVSMAGPLSLTCPSREIAFIIEIYKGANKLKEKKKIHQHFAEWKVNNYICNSSANVLTICFVTFIFSTANIRAQPAIFNFIISYD